MSDEIWKVGPIKYEYTQKCVDKNGKIETISIVNDVSTAVSTIVSIF